MSTPENMVQLSLPLLSTWHKTYIHKKSKLTHTHTHYNSFSALLRWRRGRRGVGAAKSSTLSRELERVSTWASGAGAARALIVPGTCLMVRGDFLSFFCIDFLHRLHRGEFLILMTMRVISSRVPTTLTKVHARCPGEKAVWTSCTRPPGTPVVVVSAPAVVPMSRSAV